MSYSTFQYHHQEEVLNWILWCNLVFIFCSKYHDLFHLKFTKNSIFFYYKILNSFKVSKYKCCVVSRHYFPFISILCLSICVFSLLQIYVLSDGIWTHSLDICKPETVKTREWCFGCERFRKTVEVCQPLTFLVIQC